MAQESYTVPSVGENCFKWQKKNHFSKQCKKERESLSHSMQEKDTYDISLYITNLVHLNRTRLSSSEMEIDTGCLSFLISEKQFNEQPNERLSKKRRNTDITDLFGWGHYPEGSRLPECQIQKKNEQFKSFGFNCNQVFLERIGWKVYQLIYLLPATKLSGPIESRISRTV